MQTSRENPARIKVFWQPGCSSCLRTKEFLARHGIEFESINIHNNPAGMAELEALGARSVPVVALGGRYTLCQSFNDVVKFLDLKVKLKFYQNYLAAGMTMNLVQSILAMFLNWFTDSATTRLVTSLPNFTAVLVYSVWPSTKSFRAVLISSCCTKVLIQVFLAF